MSETQTNPPTTSYDLVIVGGGMVGASLALALSGQGIRMALVEAFPPGADTQPSYDDRAIALAYGTRRIFDALSLWPDIDGVASPILNIDISDRGHFGGARLSAAAESVPALGYVVTARELGRVLIRRLADVQGLDVIAPAKVVRFSDDGRRVRIEIEQQGVVSEIETGLLVAADGGRSTIREQLSLPTQQRAYGQAAVVANITSNQPHGNVAYERFTEQGPVALLPMTGDRSALVWTVAEEDVARHLELDDADFMAEFQRGFGYRAGRFVRVGRRASYPLSLLRVKRSVHGRAVVIGNAAHTLHPIAGQGFNLGIRDVAALAEVMVEAKRANGDLGAATVLDRYEGWRLREQGTVAMATDGLARLFTNPLGIVRTGRNLGLLALEALPLAKRPLSKAAMGILGRQPKLGRGVPLD